MHRALQWAFSAVACGALSCGGASATKTAAGNPKVTRPEPEVFDTAPVPAPRGLFAVVRVQNPGKLADTVVDWLKLPLDWRGFLRREGLDVDKVLMPQAPMDFMAAFGSEGRDSEEPLWSVSVGVFSLEAALDFARKNGHPVQRLMPGVYQFLQTEEAYCAVAAARGAAPARVVCSDRRQDVEALLPYATRGLPDQSFGDAALHAELLVSAVREHYAAHLRQFRPFAQGLVRELAIDNPRFDKALEQALYALSDEAQALAQDLDRVVFDLTISPGAQAVELEFGTRFIGSKSWTAQALSDWSARAITAPELFWRLPADSAGAYFTASNVARRVEGIKNALGEMAEGFLEHAGVTALRRERIVSGLTGTMSTEPIVVEADGPVPSRGPDPDPAEAARRALGWNLIGVSGKGEKERAFFSAAADLLNEPKVRAQLDKQKMLRDLLPTVKVIKAKGLTPEAQEFQLSLADKLFRDTKAPAAGASKAASSQPDKAGKPMAYLVLMPEPDRMWFGFSMDREVLYERLKSLRTPAGSTLATRPGLESLKTETANYAGFGTLAGGISPFLKALPDKKVGALLAGAALASTPYRGQTPIVTFLCIKPGGAPVLVWKARIPKEVFQDVAALVVTYFTGGGMP
jgi:hypothetical protein